MPESNKNIFVSLPLDDIIALRRLVDNYSQLSEEVKCLSRRLDGCYAIQSECMQKLGDLSRR